jgi:hypothetical protein
MTIYQYEKDQLRKHLPDLLNNQFDVVDGYRVIKNSMEKLMVCTYMIGFKIILEYTVNKQTKSYTYYILNPFSELFFKCLNLFK